MGRFQDLVTQNRCKLFVVERMSGCRRDIARAYRESLRLERASLDEVESIQESRLRELFGKAARTPYWGKYFAEAGIAPAAFRLDQLRSLPFLTKQLLGEEGRRLCIPGARGVYENHSGGSTGVPVRFWQDYTYKVHMSVATRRCNELAGAFPGARVAKLWGAPADKRQIEGLAGRLKLWLLNMRYFDTFDMGRERMAAYHAAMERFQPDLIQAYASSIHLLARYLKAEGIRPRYPRVAILSSAEKLYTKMRSEIEDVFPVRVFDRYGSREISAVAAECACHAGLHIQMPGYIVETIDAAGASVEGRPGEIAVTVLHNHAMPFIRYRIGDMGVLVRRECSCGLRYHRLEQVIGRTSDNFLMPDGRIVHGEYFTHLFYGREGIEQFQFVQEAPRSFTLRIVPTTRYSEATGVQIANQVREIIGAASLNLEIHREIPKTPSGKYRFTMSAVSLDEMASTGGSKT